MRGAETRRPEAKHGRRTLVMERLREAEVTSAHAKARLHMFWAWTPDATPGELCVVYATTFICQFLPDTPDRKLILTTDQAVQWVGRHVPTLYENPFRTSSSKAVRSSSGVAS